MPEDLRAVVEDTDDEPTLVAWLRLGGTAAPKTSLRPFARSAPASSQPRRLVLVNRLDLVYLCIGMLDLLPVGSVAKRFEVLATSLAAGVIRRLGPCAVAIRGALLVSENAQMAGRPSRIVVAGVVARR